MRHFGIEKLDIYGGQFALEIAQLVAHRGGDLKHVAEGLMSIRRAVYPAMEDSVTMATNAVKRLLSPEDVKDIGLCIVATESSLDSSKSMSTWVHQYAELPETCRNFEIKNACYAGMAALKTALYWLASGERPGKKALVVVTDISRRHQPNRGGTLEYILGGAAVAMLVSDDPRVLAFDVSRSGTWSTNVNDFMRPTLDSEVIDSQLSLASYLDAAEGAFADYCRAVGPTRYADAFCYSIFHSPFPAMTLKAHRSLLSSEGRVPEERVLQSFRERVLPTLAFNQQVGATYGASIFISMAGLLAHNALNEGDKVSIFSYGSGCQSEFCEATVGREATKQMADRQVIKHLQGRRELTVAEYELLDTKRDNLVGVKNFAPAREDPSYDFAAAHYAGKGLLVLDSIEDYRRTYRWS